MYGWKRLISLLLVFCLLGGIALAEDEEISMDELLVEDETLEEALDEDPLADSEGESFEDFFIEAEEAAESLTLTDEDIDDSVNPDDLELNPNLPDNVLNILLIGIDTREKDVAEGDQRADVQIILSVNKETGELKLTSFMRDLYVTIPGLKSKNRLNASYSGKSGGPIRTMRTINHNFEMNVQHYVTINFYGLASIIDSLGGIDIDLTRGEAYAINAYLKEHPPKYDNTDGSARVPLLVEAGVQHLDGVQAVMYARLRKGMKQNNGDTYRTARQRHLLELLLKQALQGMTVDKLIGLVETCVPYVKTNLSPSDILSTALDVLQSGIVERMKNGEELLGQFRVPMDGTVKNSLVKMGSDEASVLEFRSDKRKQENVEGLHDFIYGNYYPAN